MEHQLHTASNSLLQQHSNMPARSGWQVLGWILLGDSMASGSWLLPLTVTLEPDFHLEAEVPGPGNACLLASLWWPAAPPSQPSLPRNDLFKDYAASGSASTPDILHETAFPYVLRLARNAVPSSSAPGSGEIHLSRIQPEPFHS